MTHGYAADKAGLVKRLHRIEGQVRGIERMVDEDRYCIDILTQISAVSTALESLAFKILDDHVNHCVTGALASGDPEEAQRKSQELLDAFTFVKITSQAAPVTRASVPLRRAEPRPGRSASRRASVPASVPGSDPGTEAVSALFIRVVAAVVGDRCRQEADERDAGADREPEQLRPREAGVQDQRADGDPDSRCDRRE